MAPIELKILTAISLKKNLQIIIDDGGYSHWQLVAGLENLLAGGLVARIDRSFKLTEDAVKILAERHAKRSRRQLGPLNEFRIAPTSRPVRLDIGRQAMNQIRNRVSS